MRPEGLYYSEVKLEMNHPEWVKNFLSEKEDFDNLKISFIKQIEHVGSTSIPGLSAKPIIDILLGIEKYKNYKKLIKQLDSLGYKFHREPRRYQALFLKTDAKGRTTHHLKVVKYAGKSWRDYLKFKDNILHDKKLANEYKKLKLELAKKYADDRKSYTSKKGEFIQKILEQ